MKVVYTAGPYRGQPNEIHDNVECARYYARELWKKGFAVICPHMNTAYMDASDLDNDIFIQGDLSILKNCDYIYLLPNWEKSEGAKIELEFARKNGIPVLEIEL
jgi:hypothetical protein